MLIIFQCLCQGRQPISLEFRCPIRKKTTHRTRLRLGNSDGDLKLVIMEQGKVKTRYRYNTSATWVLYVNDAMSTKVGRDGVVGESLFHAHIVFGKGMGFQERFRNFHALQGSAVLASKELANSVWLASFLLKILDKGRWRLSCVCVIMDIRRQGTEA